MKGQTLEFELQWSHQHLQNTHWICLKQLVRKSWKSWQSSSHLSVKGRETGLNIEHCALCFLPSHTVICAFRLTYKSCHWPVTCYYYLKHISIFMTWCLCHCHLSYYNGLRRHEYPHCHSSPPYSHALCSRVRLPPSGQDDTESVYLLLTHWDRDKMDVIPQAIYQNAVSLKKMFEFWFKFHWSLYIRVQITIFQHWFR